MSPSFGMKVIFAEHVLKETTERLFPESRHRSARVRKKLLKRFGSEFRRVPAMYVVNRPMGDILFAHPSFRARLEAAAPSLQIGGGFAFR